VDFAYAKTAPEMARWSNHHCPNAVYWLDLFVHSNFQQVGWVSDWFPYTVSETKVYGNLAEN